MRYFEFNPLWYVVWLLCLPLLALCIAEDLLFPRAHMAWAQTRSVNGYLSGADFMGEAGRANELDYRISQSHWVARIHALLGNRLTMRLLGI